MICKLITVHVKPGYLTEYLEAQEVWNRESCRDPSCLGYFCGQEPAAPDIVQSQFFWRSREDYERWMETDHDRIAEMAGADKYYERVETVVLDVVSNGCELPRAVLAGPKTEAAEVQMWSEVYRASVALRIGVRLKLFDHLGADAWTSSDLATKLQVPEDKLDKLLLALTAMGFVSRKMGEWRNTKLARHTLVAESSAYQGEMVLHNTQPEYFTRISSFGERLGLAPDQEDPDSYHSRFLRAMSETAQAGQAKALVHAVDLSDCRTLLDVGGATGPYAIALCKANPKLAVTVLDLAKTVNTARAVLHKTGLDDRIDIQAHDYREGSFPRPFDAVLISNVLRGEAPAAIDDILKRALEALRPGGRILIPDLYIEDEFDNPGLRAALFGLHVADGLNGSIQQMVDAVANAGYREVRAIRLTPCIVMNAMVVGTRT